MRTRSLGPRAGAAVALAVALVIALPASPAGAAPVITISQPAAAATLDNGSVTVTGRAEVGTDLGSAVSTLETVTVTVGGTTVEPANCAGQRACDFSATFALPSNGPYTARARVTRTALVSSANESTAQRDFFVAAPPKAPTLDKPKVNEDRSVQLSWTRNTEPDMLFYVVTRKDAGASSFAQASGKISQPSSGSKVTFTDTAPAASAGGDVAYQVIAVRKGIGSDIASAPSAAAAVTIPPPPTTTTSAPPPGAPVAPGATSTTAKPGPPGGVDLSSFLTPRSSPRSVPPLTIPEPPDTGFSGKLPFGALPAGEELEEGEEEAVPPPDRSFTSVISRIQVGRPLVPVAGGLILVLLALHLRLLNRRIKELPEGDLPVDAVETAPAGPAPVAATVVAVTPLADDDEGPRPPAPPRVESVLYDVDDDWAPVAADLEPDLEPEPHLEPEPEPEPDLEPVVAADLEPEPVVAAPEPEPVVAAPEPEPVVAAPEPDPEPEPVDEAELEVVDLWAPPVDEPFDPDAIEVFEVVSPTRRRLVRAGSR